MCDVWVLYAGSFVLLCLIVGYVFDGLGLPLVGCCSLQGVWMLLSWVDFVYVFLGCVLFVWVGLVYDFSIVVCWVLLLSVCVCLGFGLGGFGWLDTGVL